MSGTAVAIGAGIAAVGGIASSVIQSNAARSAARTQAQAAQQAQQTQATMFGQTRADLAPYNQAGQSATDALLAFYGLPGGKGPTQQQLTQNLQNLPGEQTIAAFGSQAVDRSQAAKGLLNSGATGLAQQRFGQGLAANYALPMYLGGLQGLAGQGENAAAQTGVFRGQAAQGIAGSQMAAGSAQASGQIGSANAISSGIGQLGGLAGLYGMSQNYQQGANPYTGYAGAYGPQSSNFSGVYTDPNSHYTYNQ